MAPHRLALCAAVALLWPLAATAGDRIVAFESPPFTLDTRFPAAVVVDPAARMVVVESPPFTLDTRFPTAVVVDPAARMVLVASSPFTLDTRLPAGVDPYSRMVVVESGLFPLDTRPDIGIWRNMFGCRIIGASNEVVVVEACTNLTAPLWYPLGTNALIARTFYFLDPAWTNYPERFYRVR